MAQVHPSEATVVDAVRPTEAQLVSEITQPHTPESTVIDKVAEEELQPVQEESQAEELEDFWASPTDNTEKNGDKEKKADFSFQTTTSNSTHDDETPTIDVASKVEYESVQQVSLTDDRETRTIDVVPQVQAKPQHQKAQQHTGEAKTIDVVPQVEAKPRHQKVQQQTHEARTIDVVSQVEHKPQHQKVQQQTHEARTIDVVPQVEHKPQHQKVQVHNDEPRTIDVIPQAEHKAKYQKAQVESYNGRTIDLAPTEEREPADRKNQSNSYESSPGSSLARRGDSFAGFLAPLNKDSFKEVVTGVEDKLRVVNQTLTMLTNSEGFDAILQDMLNAITLKTGELLNADRTTIYLLDEEKNELWSIVAKNEDGRPLEIRFPATQGIAGEAATFHKVINIPYDFYNDPRSAFAKQTDKKTGYRTYTMLVLPLLNEAGELVSVVQLINKLKTPNNPSISLAERIDLNGFTDEDERVFEEFAPSIRLILESSRSFYMATQKQRAADALIKANQALSQSSLDLEDTLKRVMDEAKKLMNADRSTLWLIDHDRNQLWTKIPIQGELKEIRIPRTAGFAGMVAETREPLMIPFDLYNDPRSETSKQTDQKSGYRTCSMLCMPVFNANNELIGVTQLINKKKQGDWPDYDATKWPEAPECWKASFNRTDQEFMQVFNIQAGVALQNAKLFATIKQQEQMQRDILRSLTNGVISTDKTGNIIAANESAKRLLGFSEEEKVEGKPVQELVQIKDKEEQDDRKFARWFEMALTPADDKKRHQYYPDQILESLDGEQHSVNLSINTIADGSDPTKIGGALVVMDDISDEKRLKSTMYRYMTQEVAEQLLASGDNFKMGGDRKEVTVLFSDIRSYTTLTESMEAEEVVQMLNEYFESMVDAVFRYKGTLDKYIGDAIMAVFGAFVPLADHAWMGVQTAVEMRHRLAEFNAKRREHNQKEIKIGIGINSDVVISGNIGSSQRMELTSIGDGVNLGSRLEGASKQYGCDIVISQNTYEPCADRIWHRELDFIRVKGKNEPVRIYELVGLRHEPISDQKLKLIDIYHEGRNYYLNKEFRKAMNEFAIILEDMSIPDKAASLYLKRCQHWLDNPESVETEWDDGVWTLTEK
ncbi:GAF domain-containing protein [Planktothrix sp. FACHB-1355]|uniref:GAF domain-containing protein n=1 Tax=Aerosakkonema funiforme FACHB-1375 TaxID=2949571 RepID=A0A926VGX0_9CYAN|nr:GAF domain-containing protein [Aerosakkonema funiforme FACHB-1375]MBD3560091.1 GAF domain-containing protein [Planktothrix sp. FACHB-1355]